MFLLINHFFFFTDHNVKKNFCKNPTLKQSGISVDDGDAVVLNTKILAFLWNLKNVFYILAKITSISISDPVTYSLINCECESPHHALSGSGQIKSRCRIPQAIILCHWAKIPQLMSAKWTKSNIYFLLIFLFTV